MEVKRVETDGHIAVNETSPNGGVRMYGVCPTPNGGFGMTRTTGRDWRCGCGRWRDVYDGATPYRRFIRLS